MIKYHFNERIFQNINSSEKAYWLGFMYADGYITSRGIFGCGLSEKDKEHLNKFLQFIEMPEEEQIDCIKYQTNTKSCKINLGRKDFIADLLNLGFTSNKSYDKTLNVWDGIPNQYKKEFIIGLWDGDGSFSITPKNNIQTSSLISNNDLLIEEIVRYINENLEKDFAKVKPRTPNDPYPRIRFTKDKAKIFGDWLYKENYSFVLTRKYKIYKQFHEVRGQANNGLKNPNTKGIYCLESKKQYSSTRECAISEFGLENSGAQNTIRAVCRGERSHYRNKHFRYLTPKEREELKNGTL